MTMPGKILVDTCDYDGHMEVVNEHATWAQPYIRADIAEGLVRALEEISGMGIMSCSAMAYNALVAYREASK